jgi:hypothetical protein
MTNFTVHRMPGDGLTLNTAKLTGRGAPPPVKSFLFHVKWISLGSP